MFRTSIVEMAARSSLHAMIAILKPGGGHRGWERLLSWRRSSHTFVGLQKQVTGTGRPTGPHPRWKRRGGRSLARPWKTTFGLLQEDSDKPSVGTVYKEGGVLSILSSWRLWMLSDCLGWQASATLHGHQGQCLWIGRLGWWFVYFIFIILLIFI